MIGRYPQGSLWRFDVDQPRSPPTNPGPGESRYGNDHELLIHRGKLYGVTANRLFRFDPDDRERGRLGAASDH